MHQVNDYLTNQIVKCTYSVLLIKDMWKITDTPIVPGFSYATFACKWDSLSFIYWQNNWLDMMCNTSAYPEEALANTQQYANYSTIASLPFQFPHILMIASWAAEAGMTHLHPPFHTPFWNWISNLSYTLYLRYIV
jgi:hypothetical protein